MYDLISIGSITQDIFVISDRGKIFKTPQNLLAPAWLAFELGEKMCTKEIIESEGGVATNLSLGTKKLGLRSLALGPASPTTSVIVIDQKSGERVIFYPEISGTIDLGKLKRVKTKWLSVSSLTGNWSPDAKEIIAQVEKKGIRLILAPSTSMVREGYQNLKKLLRLAEIVIMNKNEAEEISFHQRKKTSNTKDLINILHGLGPKIVCITDGLKGAWVSDGKVACHAPIKKVKTVDVTGAGDAFAAGFLGFYLKGRPIKESLRAGILNSSSVVQRVGTTTGLLTKKELLKLF